jgi:L-rhamnose mutarotase
VRRFLFGRYVEGDLREIRDHIRKDNPEYDREHTRVGPELLVKLKEAGISDYSIFRRGQELFLCMRVDNFERAWEQCFAMMKEVFYLG